jgi:hypothetical protein
MDTKAGVEVLACREAMCEDNDRIYSPEVSNGSVAKSIACTIESHDTIEITDLYSVGHQHTTKSQLEHREAIPFIHWIELEGPQGEIVWIRALFDDGAKTSGNAKSMIESLKGIFSAFAPSETFMADGGKHFNNNAVRTFCESRRCKLHMVAAYSPWVNGLVKGTNKLLLHVLKWLCAPEVGENQDQEGTWDNLPKSWPDHLDDVVHALNHRLLLALKFSPKELLLGLIINTPTTDIEDNTLTLQTSDVLTQIAYVEQQRLDGYDEMVRHAIKRKAGFNKKLLQRAPGEVIFKAGQLVQVYHNDLDYTFKTKHKLIPKWSTPHQIQARILNSYKLETLNGIPLQGEFSARRVRAFIPRQGM